MRFGLLQKTVLQFLVFLIVLSSGVSTAFAVKKPSEPRSILTLRSDAGWEYVGGGENYVYRNVSLDEVPSSWNLVSFSGNTSISEFWRLVMRAPIGQDLQVGTYTDAARWPFGADGYPQFGFDMNGRGCSKPSSTFTISQIVKDAEGKITKFAVDFEQYCDGLPSPLRGSLRYNSAIPMSPSVGVGQSYALKGLSGETDGVFEVALTRAAPKDVRLTFRTVDGTAKAGVDYLPRQGDLVIRRGTTRARVVVPIPGNRTKTGDIDFGLEVVRSNVRVVGPLGKLRLLDPNSPMTVLTLNSQGDENGVRDYVGQGRTWLVLSQISKPYAYAQPNNGFSVMFLHPWGWKLTLAGPSGELLVPGHYANAVRWSPASGDDNFVYPQLDVNGDGRGCNTLKGEFDINEIDYSPGFYEGTQFRLDKISVDFKHLCGGSEPALYGSLRVNSDLNPVSIANAQVVGTTARFKLSLAKQRGNSFAVQFETIDGTAVSGVHYSSTKTEVVFHPGDTDRIIDVPLLSLGVKNRKFFARIKAQAVPIWNSVSTAEILSQ